MAAADFPSVFPDAALPAPLTGFVGREPDVATVLELVSESRLLTLTGAGGSGKTRLAMESARALATTRPDLCVAWVELAGVADASELTPHLATTLGVRIEGGGTTVRAMSAVLQDRSVLLVLDNCEHLVDACASLVETLLQLAPRLTVLATSREALGVAGERSWLVPTLSLPAAGTGDVATALASSAVQLFVARARDGTPSFRLTAANAAAIVDICRRLDGLPLAIELAAARVGVLAPAQLAARLAERLAVLTSSARGAPPRHRTLRGTVDWSYELLEDDERLLLDRLSVFVGGFTLDAAEAICGFGPLPPARVLDVLATLAGKSLVAMQEQDGQARYRLLEMIREYAVERAAQRAEAPTLALRHAAFFRDRLLALRSDVMLGRRDALHEVDVEHGNVLAALSWSSASGHSDDVALSMVWSLTWYWYHRQRWAEGFTHTQAAVAAAVAPDIRDRAGALHGLGVFGLFRMDPRTDQWLQESEDLWREIGEERHLAFTLLIRVIAASIRADVDSAATYALEMLTLARRQPDPWDAALAKAHAMVPVLSWRGEWAEASQLLDEAIAAFRSRQYRTGVSYSLDQQAFIALQLGELDRAASLAVESLQSEREAENRWLAGRNLRILANIAERRGDLRRAALLFAITEVWYEQVGASSLSADRKVVNDLPSRLAAALPAADLRAIRERAAGYSLAEALREAMQGVAASPTREPVVAVEAAPAGLAVQALGGLRITLDGRRLDDEAWPYAKPRELLLYLLVHPEGRNREQIGLDFWPEASAAQVKNNFHVTLHHLRKTLGGGGWVRFEKGRYLMAVPLTFDVADFRRGVPDALRRLRRDPEDPEAMGALREAVAKYRGPFAEGVDVGDWSVAIRDELARHYESALLALGEAASVEGSHAEAAEWFRRLLVADPLHEEAQRLLMLSLARAERRGDALRAYERFAAALSADLKAEPSPALRKVAEAIRQGTAV